MKANRKNELRSEIIDLYAQGKEFVYGSLVHEYSTASDDQNAAIKTLEKKYFEDMQVFSCSFEYGYSSFLDCVIGKNECYREPSSKDEFPTQVCVFMLFCNYKNIFVIGGAFINCLRVEHTSGFMQRS